MESWYRHLQATRECLSMLSVYNFNMAVLKKQGIKLLKRLEIQGIKKPPVVSGGCLPGRRYDIPAVRSIS
jgi:hypothetical protein